MKRVWGFIVLFVAVLSVAPPPVFAFATKQYWATVDDYDRPTPIAGYYYNRTGGSRGTLNDANDPLHPGDVSYVWDGASAYRATAVRQPGAWTYGGMFYSLIRDQKDNIPLNFSAAFGSYVQPAYQGRVTGIELVIQNVTSPTANPNLLLRVELKNTANQMIAPSPWTLNGLTSRTYPFTWFIDLSSATIGDVQTVNWIMDQVRLNDTVTVERVRLRVQSPDLPTPDEAFLWSYTWLTTNYSPTTGLVQDRSNFKSETMENISASAKAAKLVAYAAQKGMTDPAAARAIIVKIADTLLTKVPRGPSGVNRLWPHFTLNGGSAILPGTEWASGDTAYAALDLMAALQMIGDPNHQLAGLESFVNAVDWQALRQLTASQTISHGYHDDGSPIATGWDAFGMETVGVNWAYASATGQITPMLPAPSFNGSGFIDNAQYPLILPGLDAWGNNWNAYRNNQAGIQVNWYTPAKNPFLSGSHLFGLSAAEIPEADDPGIPNSAKYRAFGVGGMIAADDGNAEVVALHYSGMIADVRPAEAVLMWNTLRQSGELSPLNNIESMRVNHATGQRTVNSLKGSWNMALQAEGWALADPAVKLALANAVQQNVYLNRGAKLVAGLPPAPTLKVLAPNTHFTILANNTITLSWQATGLPGGSAPTTISLREEGVPGVEVLRIATSRPSVNGVNTMPWYIPPGAGRENWIVHVELDNTNPTVADASDIGFNVYDRFLDPIVTVSQPNGGENLLPGQHINLQWVLGGLRATTPAHTRVLISDPSGAVIWTIDDATTSARGINNYAWTVPPELAGYSSIRLRIAVQQPMPFYWVTDESDSPFAVLDQDPPTAPINVTLAGPTTGSLLLSWSAATDQGAVIGYRLDLSTSSNFSEFWPGYANAEVGTTLSTLLTNLAPDTTYYARLRAYDRADNVSANSAMAKGTTRPVILPPASVAFSNVSYTVAMLTWSASPSSIKAASYRLDVSSASTFATFLPGYGNRNLGNMLITTVTGLQLNTTYYARIRAVDAAGNVSTNSLTAESKTLEDTAPPGVPANFQFSAVNYSSFTMTWTSSTDNVGVAGYRMDISTQPSFSPFWSSYKNLAVGNGISRVVIGATPGVVYYARLRSYDATGNTSANSPVIWTQTLADVAAPDVPSGIQFSPVNYSSFTMTWLRSSDNVATVGYRLDISTQPTFSAFWASYNNVNISGTNSRLVTGATPGAVYYVRLRAYDGIGNISANSATASVQTVPDTAPPGIPANFQFSTVNYSSFTLTWLRSTDNVAVAGYRLDISTQPGFSPYWSSYNNFATGNVTFRIATGAAPGAIYYARLRAYDGIGNISANSATASVQTLADTTPPSIPANFQFSTVNYSSFTLTWLPSTDNVAVAGYRLDISTQPSFSPFWSSYHNLSVGNMSFRSVTGAASGVTYYARLRAYDGAGNISGDSVVASVSMQSMVRAGNADYSAVVSASPLSGVRVYPNPWRSDRDGARNISFDTLPAGAQIRIFTISARWVATLTVDSLGKAAWDRRDSSGDTVASGLYLYLITDSQGHKLRGKMSIIR